MNLTEKEIKAEISSLNSRLIELMLTPANGPAQEAYQNNQEETINERLKELEALLKKAK